MLSDLSGPQFSAMIALFGTLSVSDPPCQFKSPLAQHMGKGEPRAWWGFVLQMVQDKKRVTGILKDCDLYWLMRARVSEAFLVDLNVYPGDSGEFRVYPCESQVNNKYVDSDARLMAARERYLNKDVNSVSANNHLPYLNALLSLKKEDATMEAVVWLCYLMKRDIHCTPGLLEVLWDVVLNADKALPGNLKEKIMDVISQRLTLPVNFSEEAQARFTSLPPESESDTLDKHPSFCLTALDLARQVVRILFPRVIPSLSGTASQIAIQDWAHSETRRMFSPSAQIEFRWQNLVYLALANTRSSLHTLSTFPTIQTIDSHRPSSVDFRLVAAIALIERVTSACDVSSNLQGIIRALWASWVDIANNDAQAHRAAVRPLLGTFFRVAARTRDESLVTSCVHLASVGFWQFDLGDDAARQQAQLLAVEYMAAAVVSGDTLWERIVAELPPHMMFPQWQPMLLSKTILRVVRMDAQRAVEVFQLWRRYLPVPDLSAPLGLALVQEGRADLAIPILAGVDFTGPFLGAILRPLAKEKSWYINLELAAILAKALLNIFTSEAPPQTTASRRCMAWVLLALTCSGQAPAAVSTFKNVYARDPEIFNANVLRNFLRTLLRHRQFSGAAEIANLYPHAHWRRFVQLGLAQRGGAPRVERRLGQSVRPRWLTHATTSMRLGRRHPAAGLMRHWVTRRLRTAADVRNGLKVLMHARGIHLGLRVYGRVRTRHDKGMQTALGNVILDGCASTKSGGSRNVRGLLRTLRLLIQEHGFIPDRVTTNIIVKAVLRWPAMFDPTLVRRLFDYFVSRGYPGEGVCMPFGSSDAAMKDAGVVLGTPIPMPKSKISFTRHVEPLYKMFIKALYLRKDVAGARTMVGILKEAEKTEAGRIARKG